MNQQKSIKKELTELIKKAEAHKLNIKFTTDFAFNKAEWRITAVSHLDPANNAVVYAYAFSRITKNDKGFSWAPGKLLALQRLLDYLIDHKEHKYVKKVVWKESSHLAGAETFNAINKADLPIDMRALDAKVYVHITK